MKDPKFIAGYSSPEVDAALLRGEEFHRDFLKLAGEDPEPLMPAELAQVIREVPLDAEVTDLLKTLSGPAPLPARYPPPQSSRIRILP